jgi:uncharacterized protein (TIGR02246 family)
MNRASQRLAIGAGLIALLALPSSGQATRAPAAAPAQAGATPTSSATAAAEKDVRAALAGYVAAYNARDAAKLAAFFTNDGTLIDSEDNATVGREAIVQEFSDAFAEPAIYTLDGQSDRVRLITSDVAQVEGMARLVSPKEATIATRFVALLARQGDGWKIAELRDYPAPVDSVKPHEQLKELEWMVGEWFDQSEDVEVTTTVRWGQDEAFFIRDYSVKFKGEPTSSGLMIIAWDPQTQQIKSWIFNADGSRGEASWTRATENQWVVRANGSTADGLPTSATQVISMINKDAIRTSSIDRIVGGEIAGDVEDVIMVRKPPAPATEGTPAKVETGASAR